jgi:hypothetical protein
VLLRRYHPREPDESDTTSDEPDTSDTTKDAPKAKAPTGRSRSKSTKGE